MLTRRTDLALEAKGLWEESAAAETKLEGVEARETVREGYKVTTVRILNEAGGRARGKPVGTYVPILLDG
ncbi:MAG: GPR endopeptidase, partial [Oscillospiraceae bacterium]